MTRHTLSNDCPLGRLKACNFHACENQVRPEDLDALITDYFTANEQCRVSLRYQIFRYFSPLIIKCLRQYCYVQPDCRSRCLVGDLLSDAYIGFAEYLDQFDRSRQVDFLKYMMSKLSWRIFNAAVKEQKIRERMLLIDVDFPPTLMKKGSPLLDDGVLVASLDLDDCFQQLQPKIRYLLILHHLFGYTYAELAGRRKKQEAALRKSVSRAFGKIRHRYQKVDTIGSHLLP